jgi:hypothetical protein
MVIIFLFFCTVEKSKLCRQRNGNSGELKRVGRCEIHKPRAGASCAAFPLTLTKCEAFGQDVFISLLEEVESIEWQLMLHGTNWLSRGICFQTRRTFAVNNRQTAVIISAFERRQLGEAAFEVIQRAGLLQAKR